MEKVRTNKQKQELNEKNERNKKRMKNTNKKKQSRTLQENLSCQFPFRFSPESATYLLVSPEILLFSVALF